MKFLCRTHTYTQWQSMVGFSTQYMSIATWHYTYVQPTDFTTQGISTNVSYELQLILMYWWWLLPVITNAPHKYKMLIRGKWGEREILSFILSFEWNQALKAMPLEGATPKLPQESTTGKHHRRAPQAHESNPQNTGKYRCWRPWAARSVTRCPSPAPL
jgi:hypothetical protein